MNGMNSFTESEHNMKIGILTFHRSFNYGAFMQCYSLCSKLRSEFPNVTFEVVDYTSPKAMTGYDREIDILKTEQARQAIRDRNAAFVPCQLELPLSEPQLVSDDMSQAAAYLNERYDAVIVGSDAVWNWKTRGFPNIYFLKDYRGRKLSYAASAHGLDFRSASQEQKDYLQEAFAEFDYIGVRDCNTEKLVQMVLPETKIFHNCDPTVLLSLDAVPCDREALRRKLASRGVDFSKPLIGLMAGQTIGAAVKRHYGDRVQFVAVYTANPSADVFLNDLTPYEWANVFSFFQVTLTHFFHGTLLSLRNGTPVIPVEMLDGFSSQNITKIEDLLTRLDLLSWREVLDHRNYGRFHRALDRIFHASDKAVWDRVISKTDGFLAEDQSDIIFDRLQREAQSFDSFSKALSEIISDKEGQIND